jgi:hypothetical protein
MYISTALLEFATIAIFVIVFYYNDKKKRQIEAEKREFEDEIKSLKKQIKKLEESEKKIFSKVLENEIYHVQASGEYTKYDADDLRDIIILYGRLIGVTSIDDISTYAFEDTIKAALYASKGYFDIYQTPTGETFRIGKHGKHIPITEEEEEMLRNYDFDFIYDSVPLKL